jgi:hypothetical protein
MISPERLIAPEIAARYGRPLTTVQTEWMPDPAWPARAGKRGRWNEYDAAEVAAAVKAITARPPLPGGDPGDLLTIAQAAAYARISPRTIRSDLSRGRWPVPDDDEHGVKRWKRSTVDRVMSGRRQYRRSAAR